MFLRRDLSRPQGGSTWAGTSPRCTRVHPPATRYTPGTRYTALWAGTPPDQATPPGQVPPRTRYTPQTRYPRDQVHPPVTRYPRTRYMPPLGRYPPEPGTPSLTRYTPWDSRVHPPEQCMFEEIRATRRFGTFCILLRMQSSCFFLYQVSRWALCTAV